MAKIKDRSTEIGMEKNSNYLDVHLIHNDYYSEKNTVQGEWFGNIISSFHLEDEIIEEGNITFENLRKNINPHTGEKLTPRSREGGIRYFDFQCSAQKSVSIMAMAMNDERLIEAHRNAFYTAMKELEKFAACRDNSTFGTIKEPISTGNIIAAVFHHDTSRALDPQLHTHCVISNVTYDPVNKRYVALETYNIVKAIRFLGKVYQNQLAVNVQKCGYDIELKYNRKGIIEGFEITNVSESILKLFSKRRQNIEKEIEKFVNDNGRKPTSAEIHIITKLTRDRKMAEITPAQLRKEQIKQIEEEEYNNFHKMKTNSFTNHRQEETIIYKENKNIINFAIGNLYQRKSVLNKYDILAEAINQGLGKVDCEKLINDINIHNELIKISNNNGNHYLDKIATKSGILIEQYCINAINNGLDKYNPINKNFIPFSDTESIQKEEEGNYKFETHRKVLREILLSKNKYHVIQGVAGAGKTTTLRELHKGLIDGGQKNIHYVAPTKSAVKAIFENVTKDTMTLQKFYVETNKNNINIKNGYLVIDESSLKSNIDGAKVIDLAEKNNMRVLFVGDIRQHKSIDAGDFLRIIQEYSEINVSILSEVVRQKGTYKKAIELMSRGNHHEGLKILDKDLKWINEAKGDYMNQAILKYLNFTDNGRNINKCIGVAPTHKECDKITNILREKLKEHNIIGETISKKKIFISHDWTNEKRTNLKSYQKGMTLHINIDHSNFEQNEIVTVDSIQNKRLITDDGRILSISKYKNYDVGKIKEIDLAVGDKIQFRKGDNKNNIINGEVTTIKDIDKKGNILTSDGKVIDTSFKYLRHGYFMTSHKSQGLDCDYAVIAGQYLNRDSLYVGASRGKKECSIFVPEKERLYYQIKGNTNRTAALDVLKEDLDNKNLTVLNQYMTEREKHTSLNERLENFKNLDLCRYIDEYNNQTKQREQLNQQSIYSKIKSHIRH